LGNAKDKTIERLLDAFSVETMSNEFFDKYKLHYDNFVEFLTGKRIVKIDGKWKEKDFTQMPSPELGKTLGNDYKFSKAQLQTYFNGKEKDARDFCKKLLGRIVFLYFLQKKGWLGNKDTNYKEENGDKNFMKNLWDKAKSNNKGETFYYSVLSVLFFETLNNDRPNGNFIMPDGENVKIPFLNGGLFEKDFAKCDLLCFKEQLFANLFDFFDQYNFTIYEDDPNDHTIAVDPEMLGHIFENLLEDNKDKGAYYTPKKIVHYMCQESLIEYLATRLSIENEEKKALSNFLKNKEFSDDLKPFLNNINEALDNVKICDPAIGSGAFPMGLLQEIFATKQTLYYFEHDTLESFDAANVKLNIIQNSIYGVDIEKGAVDIARLRFWLSLIIDEELPSPLPNLDYKIVVGNSLVSKFEKEVIDIDWTIKGEERQTNIFGSGDLMINNFNLLNEISKKQEAYFSPKSNKKQVSIEIRNLKIDLLINQLNLMISKNKNFESTPQKTNYKDKKKYLHAVDLNKQVDKWKNNIRKLLDLKHQSDKPLHFFDWKLDFPEVMNPMLVENGRLNSTTGFDIVIGNPPYGADIDDLVKVFEKLYPKTSHGFKDIYKYFFDKSLSLLKQNGNLCFITPNTFLRQPRYADLRRLLLEYSILELIDLGEHIFEAVVPTAISLISSNKYENVLFADLTKLNDVKSALQKIDFNVIDKNRYSQSSNNIFVGNVRQKQENEVSLEEILEMKDAGFKYQRSNVGMREKGKNDLAERIFYQGNKENEKDIKVLVGKDINSFFYDKNPDKILRHNYLSLLKDNEGTYFNKQIMGCECKLIWRQTAPYFIGTILDKPIFFGNTIQAGIIKEKFKNKISYEYLCGLLNSKYLHYLYEQNVKEEGRVFPQVKLEKLKILPIVITDNKQPFIALVKRILIAKKENPMVDTLALGKEIDVLVYKLYGLTYDEVKVIDTDFSLTEVEYQSIEV
jgi:hypothetical protein